MANRTPSRWNKKEPAGLTSKKLDFDDVPITGFFSLKINRDILDDNDNNSDDDDDSILEEPLSGVT